jgi:uncharacterized protein YxjI
MPRKPIRENQMSGTILNMRGNIFDLEYKIEDGQT